VSIYYLWRPNLKDEADNHLIELAVAGNVKCIITQNKNDFKNSDLLFPDIQIVDVREFKKKGGKAYGNIDHSVTR